MTAIGVDYAASDGQREPDWTAAKAAGLSFAYVRQCEGTWIDATCARDRDTAAAADIAYGGYLILRWPRKGEPVPTIEDQAATFIGAYGDRRTGELPPALDVEFPGANGRAGTTKTALAAIADIERAFGLLQMRYGEVTVYCSNRVWIEDLNWLPSPPLADANLWLKTAYFWNARRPWDVHHYAPADKYPLPWAGKQPLLIHQVQGDAIGFPGFNSTVDINIADEQTIAALRVLP